MSEDATDEAGAVTACERCPALVESRSRIVNGTGPDDAALVFVGEAPGADEDSEGRPFVGRSGDVLDETLAEVGLDREEIRISNCVRCRPPENRDPKAAELANCREHLDREVAHVDPDAVVTLGKVPSEHLLGRDVAITTEAGRVTEARIGGRSRPVVLSVHPAATLYDRSQRGTFEDAIASAAGLVGVEGDDQARLGEF